MIMNNKPISDLYLDACATSPPYESVVRELVTVNNNFWANSSSIHNHGIQSSYIVEKSRKYIASKLNIKSEQIIFTSGATNSIDLLFREVSSTFSSGRIVVTTVEHPCVYNALKTFNSDKWTIDYWEVDKTGIIKLENIDKYLRNDTKFVSLIWGQSEIGSVQPIKYITKLCREKNIIVHIDATQVFSQGIVDLSKLDYDFISLSAHKFRGPVGVGMLICNHKYSTERTTDNLYKLSTYSFKNGTQSAPLISAMKKAFEYLDNHITVNEHDTIFKDNYISRMTNNLIIELLKIDGVELIGHRTKRLPHHISFTITDINDRPVSSRSFIRLLSNNGISASSGTACTAKDEHDSSVLKAIGISKKYRQSVIRLSLGNWIKESDFEQILFIIKKTIAYSRTNCGHE